MVTRAARDQATREARGSGSTHLVEAGIRDARYAKGLDSYLRRGVEGIPASTLDMLTAYSVERRDLGTGTSTAGGYLIAPLVRADGPMDPAGTGRVHPALVEARQQQLALAKLVGALRLPDEGSASGGSSLSDAMREVAEARWRGERRGA